VKQPHIYTVYFIFTDWALEAESRRYQHRL